MLKRIIQSGKASKLLSDGFWVTLGFGVNSVSALLISILLARSLDEKSVGVYFLAFSIVTVMGGIAQFGLNISVVRFLSGNAQIDNDNDNDSRDMLLKMFSIVVFGGVIIAVSFMSDEVHNIFGSFDAGEDMVAYLSMIGLWVLFVALRSYLAEVFRGFHDIKLAALYQRILPNVMILLALSFMLIFPVTVSLYLVFMVSLVVNVLLVTMAIVPFIRRLKSLPVQKKASIKKILHSGSPIVTAQFLQFLVTQTPLWVLGVMAVAEDVADYGIALRFSVILSLPLLVANNVIMSRIAKFHSQNDRTNMEMLVKASVVTTSVIAIFLMFFYVVAGEWALGFLFGDEYKTAYTVLLIIAFGHIVNVFSGSPAVVLAMAGMERYIFISSILAASITVVFCLLVIPLYGIFGAALATAFGMIVLNIILAFFCEKNLEFKTFLTVSAIRETYALVKK